MSLKPHSPGCGCNCPQYLFAPTESIFPDRPSNLGSRLLTLFPVAEGTISGTSYLLDAGESLAPSPGLIHCGRAWFHEVDIFDGDADITWDGGVIEFRQAGTITVAGVAADIMPDDATIAYSRVVLYVTDAWYMVAVIRYHTVASVAGTTTRPDLPPPSRRRRPSAPRCRPPRCRSSGVRIPSPGARPRPARSPSGACRRTTSIRHGAPSRPQSRVDPRPRDACCRWWCCTRRSVIPRRR